MAFRKDKNLLIKNIEYLKLPYFDRGKIKSVPRGIKIGFCLPRNSMYILVEFCKLNGLTMAFDDGWISIQGPISTSLPEKYDSVWW